MFKCKSCGEKGYGLTGNQISKRTCIQCQKVGCNKCLNLIAVVHSGNKRFINRHTGDIWDREGYCSKKCLKNGLLEGKIRLNQDTFEEKSKDVLEMRQYYEYFLDDKEILNNFQEDFFKLIAEKNNIQKFEHVLNEYSKQSCLAQGLLIMFDGHKKLDHEKIIKGLQLCRNDPIYHNHKYIHKYVDDISKNYIIDLRAYDVPTGKLDSGNISITLAIPKDKKDMKIFACPGCGSPLNKIVMRGQVIKCDHCDGVFEAV